ncbi:cation-translocating P-type ATPase [Mycoplasmatota bacterium]|nr:cation-translocating P-type ATPase [Mycoplasmatota bacterium]
MKYLTWTKKHVYILSLSILFLISIVFNKFEQSLIAIALMSVLTILAGYHIFKKAFMDLWYKMIGIDLLVTIAVVAAFIIGDYFEAAAVTYLFTLGHILEKSALEKTRSSLKKLLDLKPSEARRLLDHQEEIVSLDSLNIDDILLVKPGEKIPTDGIIIEGSVLIDEQILTGESVPVEKGIGDAILGSTLLQTGYMKMKVSHVGEDTTLARMIHMVEEAQDKKAKTQKFMEVFSRYYTPLIVILSIVIYFLTKDIRLAITALVIACPGALVIATPVSFVAGIGHAAKKGILFKGGDSIERLAKGNLLFFDKTGTLTQGKPELKKIYTFDYDENELLRIASIGESYSEHPLASAIIDEARRRSLTTHDLPKESELIIGKGVKFKYNNIRYMIGNNKILEFPLKNEVASTIDAFEDMGYTTLIMADPQRVLGLFAIADGLRNHAKKVISEVRSLGIKDIIMLTGDQDRVAKQVSDEVGIKTYHAKLLPEDKANIVKSYQEHHQTIFVGDGINDALALSYATASVAIGGVGKDLAMETADVVLMSEDLSKLSNAIKISKKVKINMFQNIIFALVIVSFLMIGVLFKKVTMSMGMLVHELSVLVVILNAIRLLKHKSKK